MSVGAAYIHEEDACRQTDAQIVSMGLLDRQTKPRKQEKYATQLTGGSHSVGYLSQCVEVVGIDPVSDGTRETAGNLVRHSLTKSTIDDW